MYIHKHTANIHSAFTYQKVIAVDFIVKTAFDRIKYLGLLFGA